MKTKIKEMFKNGFFKGTGLAAGLFATGLMAAAVTGTINTFGADEVIDAARFNTNFETLKTAIEAINPQFSATETATDQVWTDGKTIYRKVIDVGSLPNTATKNVAHGITSISRVIRIGGNATDSTNFITLPHADLAAAGTNQVQANGTNVLLKTSANWSAFSGYVILEYTKP